MENMESNTVTKEELEEIRNGSKKSSKVVEVLSNVPIWDISYPNGTKRTVGRGQTIKFNLSDAGDLKALLEIVKQINRNRTNTLVRLRTESDGFKIPETYKKFEIVKGENNIPSSLRKYSYRQNKGFTEEEVKDIKVLCPDFFNVKPSRNRR